ncbi:trimeric intracellular cation channel family protein [Pararhodobacter sp. CCB-MM2]|uniref:trimeric intracellular cation channel family protein n=1 Tax=Pararhodobacter sp. CCB-MM2 TaxID=1786003 RepID=UPI00082F2F51|nr:trimeric intracellular cation channel family protein [Pararhodobacter sp. CCB-MM2]MCA2013028.1 trimeric intracellular cation channel family protein [Cereibacter sphaeroides]
MTLLQGLDYLSVFIFALTGALVASRAQLDLLGFAFIAALTAVGGGTIRDVLLNREAVFWIANPWYIGITSVAALIVFFTAHLLENRRRAIDWLDAGALAVAVPAGVGVALSLDHSPAVVVMMGMITGAFGGLMRDVVCNEVPLVLRQGELYLSAAFAGAVTALLVRWGIGPSPLALIGCAAVTFLLRAGSMAFGWKLPVYKSRPPKRRI